MTKITKQRRIYCMSEEWKVATPIDSFANPATGSQIDVVSMIHVGAPSYYQNLGRYIVARQEEGFTVHYEAITESDKKTETVGPLERIKQRILFAERDHLDEAYALVMEHSCYTVQDDTELFLEDGSENHDMSATEIVSHMGLLTHIIEWSSTRKLRHKLEKAARRGPEEINEYIFGLIKNSVDMAASGKAGNKRRDKVVVNMRNQAALGGIDSVLKENADARLVLVWGMGHFAGLQSGLIERGYDHSSRQETTVAVNQSQLDRDMQKLQATLRSQQAKADRYQAIGHRAERSVGRLRTWIKPDQKNRARSYAVDVEDRRNRNMAQFEKDQLKRQKAVQERLDASNQRPEAIMRKIEENDKPWSSNLYISASSDKKRPRRFLLWLSNK